MGFHTSAAKGWPDLAYNFLVDRFGRAWEGRTGSLAGPVAGDATGGGYFDSTTAVDELEHSGKATALVTLCIGAFAAMAGLVGALAGRSGIALGDGATATFTSRGSNRHPAGAQVTTPTIAGHREYFELLVPEEPFRFPMKDPYPIDNEGFANVPQRPGIGVELDWDRIENTCVEHKIREL